MTTITYNKLIKQHMVYQGWSIGTGKQRVICSIHGSHQAMKPKYVSFFGSVDIMIAFTKTPRYHDWQFVWTIMMIESITLPLAHTHGIKIHSHTHTYITTRRDQTIPKQQLNFYTPCSIGHIILGESCVAELVLINFSDH